MKVIKQLWDLLAWLGPSVRQETKKVSRSQVLLLIMLYISLTVLESLVCWLELEQRQSGHVWPLFLQISNTGHSWLWHKHQWFQHWACRSSLFLSLTKTGSHQILLIFSFSVKFISKTFITLCWIFPPSPMDCYTVQFSWMFRATSLATPSHCRHRVLKWVWYKGKDSDLLSNTWANSYYNRYYSLPQPFNL